MILLSRKINKRNKKQTYLFFTDEYLPHIYHIRHKLNIIFIYYIIILILYIKV